MMKHPFLHLTYLFFFFFFLAGCGCDAPMECEPEGDYGGIDGKYTDSKWHWDKVGQTCIKDCSTRLFSTSEGGTKFTDWIRNEELGVEYKTQVIDKWEKKGVLMGSILGDTLFGVEWDQCWTGDEFCELRILMMDLSENKMLGEYVGELIPIELGGGGVRPTRWGTDSLFFSFWGGSIEYKMEFGFDDDVRIDSSHSMRWTLDMATGKIKELDINAIFGRDHIWHAFRRERCLFGRNISIGHGGENIVF